MAPVGGNEKTWITWDPPNGKFGKSIDPNIRVTLGGDMLVARRLQEFVLMIDE